MEYNVICIDGCGCVAEERVFKNIAEVMEFHKEAKETDNEYLRTVLRHVRDTTYIMFGEYI